MLHLVKKALEDFDRPFFLSNLFNKISPLEKASLVQPFSSQEIKVAVWDCGSDKSLMGLGFVVVVSKYDSKLMIEIKIKTQLLSPGVIYGVYLIFKFVDPKHIPSKLMYVSTKRGMKPGMHIL